MDEVVISAQDVRKLLGSANADAALLYLHIQVGGALNTAGAALRMSSNRVSNAAEALRQFGMLPTMPLPSNKPYEPPVYSESDVLRRLQKKDTGFEMLRGDIQRRYGRILTTEETKSLIAMIDDMQLPTEVVSMLLTFCIERTRRRGQSKMPTLRQVEQEAYRWAEAGINTVEIAAAYMQEQMARSSRVAGVVRLLGIKDRALLPTEEKNILTWFDMGFGEAEIRLAYERTLENLGHFKWSYTATILKNWNSAGLHTIEQIQQNDTKVPHANERKNSQFQQHGKPVSSLAQQAIAKMLQEEA